QQRRPRDTPLRGAFSCPYRPPAVAHPRERQRSPPVPIAILALALGTFGIGTTEFVIMGMLPQVGGDLGVDVPTAGQYVSSYAIGVVVGAPLLTAATVRLPRRWTLIGLLALFTLGNLLSALAPTHAALLATRFLTALPHGALFGVGM